MQFCKNWGGIGNLHGNIYISCKNRPKTGEKYQIIIQKSEKLNQDKLKIVNKF